MKKRLILAIAALAVLAMSAVSFAANTAAISVTSEPIRENATCDKAGGFAITFDDGTMFNGGDQITFDLDFGVTLCRDIDLEIGIQGNAAVGPHASNFTSVYTLLPKGSADSPLTGDGTLSSKNGGVLFKVTGTDGSQRVTINVMSDIDADGTLDTSDTATLAFGGTTATDELELAFLDQATYTTADGDAGIFSPDSDGIYDANDATAADNTLCIDVSAESFTANTVNANFDSKDDKYTWIPSNPQVAHVVSASSFLFEECKGRSTGFILDPGSASQDESAVCNIIENDYSGDSGGFCTNTDSHDNNSVIIRTANNTAFEADNYQIELEILVNGASGENGVYWTDQEIATAGYSNESDACDADNSDGSSIGSHSWELADGDSATPSDYTDPDINCDIDDDAKAVKVTTGAHSLNLDGIDDDYLFINLPMMVKDSTVDTGDLEHLVVNYSPAPGKSVLLVAKLMKYPIA